MLEADVRKILGEPFVVVSRPSVTGNIEPFDWDLMWNYTYADSWRGPLGGRWAWLEFKQGRLGRVLAFQKNFWHEASVSFVIDQESGKYGNPMSDDFVRRFCQ
jgi:hypothetical protein